MISIYEAIFDNILEAMGVDNGCTFGASEEQRREAEEPIMDLVRAGYFLEPAPDDLEASFWMAAAGEETEAKEFFSREPAAYEKLSDLLTRIFNQ